jgi:hypothetical protein
VLKRRILATASLAAAMLAPILVGAQPAAAHATDPPHCGVASNGNNWYWGWCHTSRPINYRLLIHCVWAGGGGDWYATGYSYLQYGASAGQGIGCPFAYWKDDGFVDWKYA